MKVGQTVVIPVLNGTNFIAEALGSVLSQLDTGDEVLVVDNGSTDGTQHYVESFPDSRVRLLHAARRGPAAARNVGLAAAQGEFVSFLDHDDLWPEGRNGNMLALLATDPDVDAVAGSIRVRFDNGIDEQYQKLDGATSDAAVVGNFLFRRSIIGRVAPFDEELTYGDDSDFLLRLRSVGMRTAAYTGDALIYRRHAANMTLDRSASRRGSMAVLARNIARLRESKN